MAGASQIGGHGGGANQLVAHKAPKHIRPSEADGDGGAPPVDAAQGAAGAGAHGKAGSAATHTATAALGQLQNG